MSSTFWRGVALFNQSDSNAGQSQVSAVAASGLSRDPEGFSEFLKNVMLLKSVIDKLMDKVAQWSSDLPQLTQYRILQWVFLRNGFW